MFRNINCERTGGCDCRRRDMRCAWRPPPRAPPPMLPAAAEGNNSDPEDTDQCGQVSCAKHRPTVDAPGSGSSRGERPREISEPAWQFPNPNRVWRKWAQDVWVVAKIQRFQLHIKIQRKIALACNLRCLTIVNKLPATP